MGIRMPIGSMTNQEAKRSLLLQTQRASHFQEELRAMDIDALGDHAVNMLVAEAMTIDTNFGLTLDRIQATGG